MNTLQAAWHGYLETVVPDDAKDVQLKETEQAFYAGALSTFQLMLQFADFQEDTAAMMVDTLNQEILNKCDAIAQNEPTLSSEPRQSTCKE